MNKKSIFMSIAYVGLFLFFVYGMSYLLNLLRIQNSSVTETLPAYLRELAYFLLFGLVISIPDFYVKIKNPGIIKFDGKRFLLLVIPCTIIILLNFQLVFGSLFFNKIASYSTFTLLGYSILSSFTKKEIKQ